MNVYILDSDANRYQNLVPVREADWDVFDAFRGTPIGASWSPVKVEVLVDDLHKNRPPSDFPSLATDVPVFSQRAAEALGDLLEGNGELLPLDCDEGVYYAYNVTHVVDALDVAQSEFKRFESGRIMDIVQHVFQPEKLAGLTIFKLPYMRVSRVYVTDDFVRRVQETGLTGFDFRPAWSGSDS